MLRQKMANGMDEQIYKNKMGTNSHIKTKQNALKAFQRARTKLGKDHPYTIKKHEEYKNVRNLKDNIGINNSTNKVLTKRYELRDIGRRGGENDNTITKKDKNGNIQTYTGRKAVDITSNSGSGNPNVFEAHHNKYNRNAWKAEERLRRYLNGERKHLQRDKEGNIIKNSKGKPLYYYDKFNRDEKTGQKLGRAKEYTDKEYTKKHDENISTKVNPTRDSLIKKSFKERGVYSTLPKTINGPIIHLNDKAQADSKQYNSKTGKIDKPLEQHKEKYENMVNKYQK